MKQTSFVFLKNYKKEFGGDLLKGKRKEERPLSTKDPIHLILRADDFRIFLPGNHKQEKLLAQLAAELGIRVYQKSFNWNHLHLLIQIPSRKAYTSFIRQFAAAIVGSTKNKMQYSTKESYQSQNLSNQNSMTKIFTLRPYTRIVSWGRDFLTVKKYHDKNNREAWRLDPIQMKFIEASLPP